jgi:hypothetical protein
MQPSADGTTDPSAPLLITILTFGSVSAIILFFINYVCCSLFVVTAYWQLTTGYFLNQLLFVLAPRGTAKIEVVNSAKYDGDYYPQNRIGKALVLRRDG